MIRTGCPFLMFPWILLFVFGFLVGMMASPGVAAEAIQRLHQARIEVVFRGANRSHQGRPGVNWFGLVWFGLVWFGLVWFGLVWFGSVSFRFVLFGLVWFGLVWFGLVWFGLVWFGLV